MRRDEVVGDGGDVQSAQVPFPDPQGVRSVDAMQEVERGIADLGVPVVAGRQVHAHRAVGRITEQIAFETIAVHNDLFDATVRGGRDVPGGDQGKGVPAERVVGRIGPVFVHQRKGDAVGPLRQRTQVEVVRSDEAFVASQHLGGHSVSAGTIDHHLQGLHARARQPQDEIRVALLQLEVDRAARHAHGGVIADPLVQFELPWKRCCRAVHAHLAGEVRGSELQGVIVFRAELEDRRPDGAFWRCREGR